MYNVHTYIIQGACIYLNSQEGNERMRYRSLLSRIIYIYIQYI